MAGWSQFFADLPMSTSEITLPPTLSTDAPRRRRWMFVIVPIGVLLIAFFIVAAIVTIPYDELVPGQAVAVSSLISVPPGKGHRLHGQVLLTDVGLIQNLRLIALLPAWLNSDNTLVRTAELTGNLPQAEEDEQGTVDMAESQLTANAVALRQLGYRVPEHDAGATVYALAPGTPGYKVLTVGDVITSVDSVPTPTNAALVDAVRSHAPGQTVTLRVGSIAHPTQGHNVSLRLGSGRLPGKTIHRDGKTVHLLGKKVALVGIVSMGTQPVYDLPFQIKINSDQIGGPSAGLAWTLGIINSLSGGHVTGGRTVAASGTIDPNGAVGDVGGVAQKTVAVERAGATVFLVPDQELAVARSKATPNLKVYGVSSLAQAMRDLQTLGGRLGSAAAGPPPGPDGPSVPYDWQGSPWS
jgi:PDZ domain-containing protein